MSQEKDRKHFERQKNRFQPTPKRALQGSQEELASSRSSGIMQESVKEQTAPVTVNTLAEKVTWNLSNSGQDILRKLITADIGVFSDVLKDKAFRQSIKKQETRLTKIRNSQKLTEQTDTQLSFLAVNNILSVSEEIINNFIKERQAKQVKPAAKSIARVNQQKEMIKLLTTIDEQFEQNNFLSAKISIQNLLKRFGKDQFLEGKTKYLGSMQTIIQMYEKQSNMMNDVNRYLQKLSGIDNSSPQSILLSATNLKNMKKQLNVALNKQNKKQDKNEQAVTYMGQFDSIFNILLGYIDPKGINIPQEAAKYCKDLQQKAAQDGQIIFKQLQILKRNKKKANEAPYSFIIKLFDIINIQKKEVNEVNLYLKAAAQLYLKKTLTPENLITEKKKLQEKYSNNQAFVNIAQSLENLISKAQQKERNMKQPFVEEKVQPNSGEGKSEFEDKFKELNKNTEQLLNLIKKIQNGGQWWKFIPKNIKNNSIFQPVYVILQQYRKYEMNIQALETNTSLSKEEEKTIDNAINFTANLLERQNYSVNQDDLQNQLVRFKGKNVCDKFIKCLKVLINKISFTANDEIQKLKTQIERLNGVVLNLERNLSDKQKSLGHFQESARKSGDLRSSRKSSRSRDKKDEKSKELVESYIQDERNYLNKIEQAQKQNIKMHEEMLSLDLKAKAIEQELLKVEEQNKQLERARSELQQQKYKQFNEINNLKGELEIAQGRIQEIQSKMQSEVTYYKELSQKVSGKIAQETSKYKALESQNQNLKKNIEQIKTSSQLEYGQPDIEAKSTQPAGIGQKKSKKGLQLNFGLNLNTEKVLDFFDKPGASRRKPKKVEPTPKIEPAAKVESQPLKTEEPNWQAISYELRDELISLRQKFQFILSQKQKLQLIITDLTSQNNQLKIKLQTLANNDKTVDLQKEIQQLKVKNSLLAQQIERLNETKIIQIENEVRMAIERQVQQFNRFLAKNKIEMENYYLKDVLPIKIKEELQKYTTSQSPQRGVTLDINSQAFLTLYFKKHESQCIQSQKNFQLELEKAINNFKNIELPIIIDRKRLQWSRQHEQQIRSIQNDNAEINKKIQFELQTRIATARKQWQAQSQIEFNNKLIRQKSSWEQLKLLDTNKQIREAQIKWESSILKQKEQEWAKNQSYVIEDEIRRKVAEVEKAFSQNIIPGILQKEHELWMIQSQKNIANQREQWLKQLPQLLKSKQYRVYVESYISTSSVQYEKKIKVLQISLSKTQERLRQTELLLANSEVKVKQLISQISQHDLRLQEVVRQKQKAESEVNRIIKQYQLTSKQTIVQSQRLTEELSRSRMAESQISELKKILQKQKEQIFSLSLLSKEMELLKKQNLSLKEVNSSNESAKWKQISKVREKFEVQILNLSNERNTLLNKLSEVQGKKYESADKQSLLSLERQIATLLATIKTKDTEISFLKRSIDHHKDELKEGRDQYSEALEQKAIIQRQLSQIKTSKVQLEYELKYLRERQQSFKKKIQTKDQELVNLKKKENFETNILESKTKSNFQALASYQARFSEIQSMLSLKTQQCQSLTIQIDRLRYELQRNEAILHSSALQIEGLKIHLKQTQSHFTKLKIDYERNQEELGKTKLSLIQSLSREEENNQQIQIHIRSIKQLESQKLRVEAENQKINDQFNKLWRQANESQRAARLEAEKSMMLQRQIRQLKEIGSRQVDSAQIQMLTRINSQVSDLTATNRQLTMKLTLLQNQENIASFSQDIIKFFLLLQKHLDLLVDYLLKQSIIPNLEPYHQFLSQTKPLLASGQIPAYFAKWQVLLRQLFNSCINHKTEEMREQAQELLHLKEEMNDILQKQIEASESEQNHLVEDYKSVLVDIKSLVRQYINSGDREYLSLLCSSLGIQQ